MECDTVGIQVLSLLSSTCKPGAVSFAEIRDLTFGLRSRKRGVCRKGKGGKGGDKMQGQVYAAGVNSLFCIVLHDLHCFLHVLSNLRLSETTASIFSGGKRQLLSPYRRKEQKPIKDLRCNF